MCSNRSNCGVFAIAFLVNLLFDVDPTTVKFDVGKIRSHLYSCLQNGKFEHPFPKAEGKHEHGLLNNLVIEVLVYGVCRMPYFEDDDVKLESFKWQTVIVATNGTIEVVWEYQTIF